MSIRGDKYLEVNTKIAKLEEEELLAFSELSEIRYKIQLLRKSRKKLDSDIIGVSGYALVKGEGDVIKTIRGVIIKVKHQKESLRTTAQILVSRGLNIEGRYLNKKHMIPIDAVSFD